MAITVHVQNLTIGVGQLNYYSGTSSGKGVKWPDSCPMLPVHPTTWFPLLRSLSPAPAGPMIPHHFPCSPSTCSSLQCGQPLVPVPLHYLPPVACTSPGPACPAPALCWGACNPCHLPPPPIPAAYGRVGARGTICSMLPAPGCSGSQLEP